MEETIQKLRNGKGKWVEITEINDDISDALAENEFVKSLYCKLPRLDQGMVLSLSEVIRRNKRVGTLCVSSDGWDGTRRFSLMEHALATNDTGVEHLEIRAKERSGAPLPVFKALETNTTLRNLYLHGMYPGDLSVLTTSFGKNETLRRFSMTETHDMDPASLAWMCHAIALKGTVKDLSLSNAVISDRIPVDITVPKAISMLTCLRFLDVSDMLPPTSNQRSSMCEALCQVLKNSLVIEDMRGRNIPRTLKDMCGLLEAAATAPSQAFKFLDVQSDDCESPLEVLDKGSECVARNPRIQNLCLVNDANAHKLSPSKSSLMYYKRHALHKQVHYKGERRVMPDRAAKRAARQHKVY